MVQVMKGVRVLEVAHDEQALANDMFFEVEWIDGQGTLKIARGPVQFDHQPVETSRSPQAFEHTEPILLDMGLGWDRIEGLKAAGVLA